VEDICSVPGLRHGPEADVGGTSSEKECLIVLTLDATRDLVAGMNAQSARWLVDYYYAIQDFRIQAQGQLRAIVQEADEGTFQIGEQLLGDTSEIEKMIKKPLDVYTDDVVSAVWAKSICGIGPVLAAGLAAHIDIEKAPTVGHIWRFAGLDPTVKWGKGEKRPWNASLKVLSWKIGDSFVKVSGKDTDVYGKVYRARKEQEIRKNEAGDFADQAAAALAERKFKVSDTRKAYEAGRLPDGRIDLRARRYAVKLFLAHYHHVAYEDHYGEPPPKPYALTHLDHAHFIAPPNWPL
jgi:hypothetical protein